MPQRLKTLRLTSSVCDVRSPSDVTKSLSKDCWRFVQAQKHPWRESSSKNECVTIFPLFSPAWTVGARWKSLTLLRETVCFFKIISDFDRRLDVFVRSWQCCWQWFVSLEPEMRTFAVFTSFTFFQFSLSFLSPHVKTYLKKRVWGEVYRMVQLQKHSDYRLKVTYLNDLPC